MKKSFTPILLALLLFLAACSAQSAPPCACSTPEERLQALAEALYTLPDEYHLNEENLGALFWGRGGGDFPEALRAWEAHDRERFHPDDFAPGVLEELTTLQDGFASDSIDALGIIGPRYSRYCINRDFPVGLEKMLLWAEESALTCTAVESEEQEDGSWQFGALVILTEPDGTETAFNIHGTAQFEEDGRFTSVHIPDDGGLSEYLEDEIIWAGPGKVIVGYGNGPSPGPLVTPQP